MENKLLTKNNKPEAHNYKVACRTVTIIGAGMGGSLLAIFLARRQFTVEIFEARDDISKLPILSYKSINQSLSVRGIRALQDTQLWDSIKPFAAREHGRVVHSREGAVYQSYGQHEGRAEWSINRNDLNQALLREVAKYPNISVHYNEKCTNIDFEKRTITLTNQITHEEQVRPVQFLVGADGIHSEVRAHMEKSGHTSAYKDILDWGYKNMYVPVSETGELPFETHAFHLWSRKCAAVFGIPNKRGFFTCTITLPMQGADSFESINSKESFERFFKTHFPDLYTHIAPYAADFLEQRASPFCTLYTNTWHYQDFCTLIGDAAHAATIFYGQGINAAFEDCRIFAECIDRAYPDLKAVFAEFEQLRKPNTDVLGKVSAQRLTDLRDKFESPVFIARGTVEAWLESKFPNTFHSLYTLVVHTTRPYARALARYRRERFIAKVLGIDVLSFLVALPQLFKKAARM